MDLAEVRPEDNSARDLPLETEAVAPVAEPAQQEAMQMPVEVSYMGFMYIEVLQLGTYCNVVLPCYCQITYSLQ